MLNYERKTLDVRYSAIHNLHSAILEGRTSALPEITHLHLASEHPLHHRLRHVFVRAINIKLVVNITEFDTDEEVTIGP